MLYVKEGDICRHSFVLSVSIYVASQVKEGILDFIAIE
jgi:hypothetical protein